MEAVAPNDVSNASTLISSGPGLGERVARTLEKISKVFVRQISYISARSNRQSSDSTQASTPRGSAPDGEASTPIAIPAVESIAQEQRVSDDIEPQGLGTPVTPLLGDAHPPTPPWQGLVSVRPSKKAMGNGIFAVTALGQGEIIFHENPWLSCKYHGTRWHPHCTAVNHWEQLYGDKRHDLRMKFPQLRALPDKELNSRQKKKLVKFVGEYAFRPDQGNPELALVYLDPCLMNHACEKHANCSFSVKHDEPYAIEVKTKEYVLEDEELLITYPDQKVAYSCAGCCSPFHYKLRRTCHKIKQSIHELPGKLKRKLKRSKATTDESGQDSQSGREMRQMSLPDVNDRPTQQQGVQQEETARERPDNAETAQEP